MGARKNNNQSTGNDLPNLEAIPGPAAPLSVRLSDCLTRDQLVIAAWYWHDCKPLSEIAELFGTSRQTVSRALEEIKTIIASMGLPAPKQPPQPETRHIRQIAPRVWASL
jgi:hypothetical protein